MINRSSLLHNRLVISHEYIRLHTVYIRIYLLSHTRMYTHAIDVVFVQGTIQEYTLIFFPEETERKISVETTRREKIT